MSEETAPEGANVPEVRPRLDVRAPIPIARAHAILLGKLSYNVEEGLVVANNTLVLIAEMFLLSRPWEEQLAIARFYAPILERINDGDMEGLKDAEGFLRVPPFEPGEAQETPIRRAPKAPIPRPQKGDTAKSARPPRTGRGPGKPNRHSG